MNIVGLVTCRGCWKKNGGWCGGYQSDGCWITNDGCWRAGN